MSHAYRYSVIFVISITLLGGLACFLPQLLAPVRLVMGDGPRELQLYYRESRRFDQLDEYNRKLVDRREKAHQLVQAICKEEIGVCEAAVRLKALEKKWNLPPLTWATVPKERWPEQLHLCLIEHVASELSGQPDKAAHLIPKLVKEVQNKFGLIQMPALELPKSEMPVRNGVAPLSIPPKAVHD